MIMTLTVLLAVFAMAVCTGPARAEDTTSYDGNLRIENGTLLQMCEYSDPRDPAYSNENSDILRFCGFGIIGFVLSAAALLLLTGDPLVLPARFCRAVYEYYFFYFKRW